MSTVARSNFTSDRPRPRLSPRFRAQVRTPAEQESETDKVDESVEHTSASADSERKEASPFRDVPPVYVGHFRLLNWGNTSNSGMYFKAKLLDVDIDEKHPFKGLRAARGSKTEGQRMQIVVNYRADSDHAPEEVVYKGEVILVWWAEDCAAGMQVNLRLDEGPDGANFQHPFENMETGVKGGEILSLVAWAMDDEDQPEVANAGRKKRSFEELSPTAQSHILCRDERFFNWLARNEARFVPSSVAMTLGDLRANDHQSYCEHVVKVYCGIESRADFNSKDEHGENARRLWEEMVVSYTSVAWGRRK
jgi:hypothetical protein